ncbi:MAG TPA: glutamate-cysteine ligase family protein [Gemmatimonadaceae bacterium]|nr:glutamate-cysteine ligase family protein [Gemmatimonadaceae bacterium]
MLAELRERFFSPSRSASPLTIGIELELIPVFAESRLPALPTSVEAESTTSILSRLGHAEGWREEIVGDDPPAWILADGARISFEPGGQIEIGSAPAASASAVIAAIQTLVAQIRAAMQTAGVELLSTGVDPFNDIDAVPLQLRRDRYARMTRFFESIGASGVRMMRQTAAVQINIERGHDPLPRWRLLNSLAPYIVALFANSALYAGKKTGHASYRAHLWRTLDPSRTGLPYDAGDPAKRYLDFALDAKAIATEQDGSRTFREWMRGGAPGEADWVFHLSTLFPEIRPKEFFEIRSADAIDPDSLAAAVVFITGLVYDDGAASRAASLLREPSEELLVRAGKAGVDDPAIRGMLRALTDLAVAGATSLGDSYLSAEDIRVAREYFARVVDRASRSANTQ